MSVSSFIHHKLEKQNLNQGKTQQVQSQGIKIL